MTRSQRDAYTVAINTWAMTPVRVYVEDYTNWQYGAGPYRPGLVSRRT